MVDTSDMRLNSHWKSRHIETQVATIVFILSDSFRVIVENEHDCWHENLSIEELSADYYWLCDKDTL